MKGRLAILIAFIIYFILFGYEQYIMFWENVTKYKELSMEIQECDTALKESKLNNAEIKRMKGKYKYVTIENIPELIDGISGISGCQVTEISALEIINNSDVLVLATTTKKDDVVKFSSNVSGVALTVSSTDFINVVKYFEESGCIIHNVFVDKLKAEVVIQILII